MAGLAAEFPATGVFDGILDDAEADRTDEILGALVLLDELGVLHVVGRGAEAEWSGSER